MSSDTPETDAAVIAAGGDWSPVLRVTSQRLERERDEARARMVRYNHFLQQAEENLESIYKERDEARKRASDLALGVKVADCVYDCGEYSVALREAKIRARYLQDLTRAAYDEVEKLEDQEGAK